jgi:hypothetical protein
LAIFATSLFCHFYLTMNANRIENKLKRRLTKAGISIAPDSEAARGLKGVAKAGSSLLSAGRRALHAVEAAADTARVAVHEATKPKAPAPKAKPAQPKR